MTQFSQKIYWGFLILSFSSCNLKKINCMELVRKLSREFLTFVSSDDNKHKTNPKYKIPNSKIANEFVLFLQERSGLNLLKVLFTMKSIDRLFSKYTAIDLSMSKDEIIDKNKIEWIKETSNENTNPEQLFYFIFSNRLYETTPINEKTKVFAFMSTEINESIYQLILVLLESQTLNGNNILQIIKVLKKNILFYLEIKYLLKALQIKHLKAQEKKLQKQILWFYDKGEIKTWDIQELHNPHPIKLEYYKIQDKITRLKQFFLKKDNVKKLNLITKKYTTSPSFLDLTKQEPCLYYLLNIETKRKIKQALSEEKIEWPAELEELALYEYLINYIEKYIMEFLNVLTYIFNDETFFELLTQKIEECTLNEKSLKQKYDVIFI